MVGGLVGAFLGIRDGEREGLVFWDKVGDGTADLARHRVGGIEVRRLCGIVLEQDPQVILYCSCVFGLIEVSS